MVPTQSNGPSRGDGMYWIIALILIFTGIAAPIGVLMIVLKLLNGADKRSSRNASFNAQNSQTPLGARTTAWEPVPPKVGGSTPQQSVPNSGAYRAAPPPRQYMNPNPTAAAEPALRAQNRKANMLTAIGGVLTAVFGIATPSSLGDAFYWLFQLDAGFFVQDLMECVPLLCFLGAGIGILVAGIQKRNQVKRFRRYLAMIAGKKTISVSALANATNLSPARVRDDLLSMLDSKVLPQGFLDYGNDRLILSGEGLRDEPVQAPKQAEQQKKQAEQPAPPKQSPEDAILAEIREVNDMVNNPRLSAQIDRIGIITGKILDYQRSHPERAPQLHSFLSYYLPTTLKILRAYGELERQEIAGENITAAMKRIEGMMDKVVDGFEKQLDQLFQGDAMDITADVEVLERMLAKDGLSDAGGITLSF